MVAEDPRSAQVTPRAVDPRWRRPVTARSARAARTVARTAARSRARTGRIIGPMWSPMLLELIHAAVVGDLHELLVLQPSSAPVGHREPARGPRRRPSRRRSCRTCACRRRAPGRTRCKRVRLAAHVAQRGRQVVRRRQRRREQQQRFDLHVVGQSLQRPHRDARAAAVAGEVDLPPRVGAVELS